MGSSKKKSKAASATLHVELQKDASTFMWVYKKETYVSTPESRCMFCLRVAVIRLTGAILAEQTDGTTHVCHPLAGGCNHGFAEDELKKAVAS